MKIKTILDAMELARHRYSLDDYEGHYNIRRHRQYKVFRERILKMERELEEYKVYHGYHMGDMIFIETMHDKDQRIAELERQIEGLRSMREGAE